MKRFCVIILIISMMILGTSCGAGSGGNAGDDNGKISIVTTVFASYDWTRNLIKGCENRFDLVFLTDSGVDLHSFQPGVIEVAEITDCDLLIRTGGESESFIDDIEAGGSFEGMEVNMLEILGKDAIMIDGEDGEEPDEHVWMSLRNAERFCDDICDALKELDPENAAKYEANLEAYLKELDELDGEYQARTSKVSKGLVIGDRFPFIYLFNDYGIEYFSAFSGCSSETDASFETVTTLAKKVDELGLKYVLTVEGSNSKVAQAIINVTEKGDQKILELDSMQTVSSSDIERGKTYISTMRHDLEILLIAEGIY